jgi:hypothetical protein
VVGPAVWTSVATCPGAEPPFRPRLLPDRLSPLPLPCASPLLLHVSPSLALSWLDNGVAASLLASMAKVSSFCIFLFFDVFPIFLLPYTITFFLISLLCFTCSFALLLCFFHEIIWLLYSVSLLLSHRQFRSLPLVCSMKCLTRNLLCLLCLASPRLLCPCVPAATSSLQVKVCLLSSPLCVWI